jgi:hypothetical protein
MLTQYDIYPSLTQGCKLLWSYYGTGHGKGEWDGAGTVVKRALRMEQLRNPNQRLYNAMDWVTFLYATLVGEVPKFPTTNNRSGKAL